MCLLTTEEFGERCIRGCYHFDEYLRGHLSKIPSQRSRPIFSIVLGRLCLRKLTHDRFCVIIYRREILLYYTFDFFDDFFPVNIHSLFEEASLLKSLELLDDDGTDVAGDGDVGRGTQVGEITFGSVAVEGFGETTEGGLCVCGVYPGS